MDSFCSYCNMSQMSQTCHRHYYKEYIVNWTCSTCHKPFYNNKVYVLIL